MHLFAKNTRFTFGWGERKINEHTVNNGSLTHVKDCVVNWRVQDVHAKSAAWEKAGKV